MENIYLIRKTVQHIANLMETLVSQQCQHRERCRMVSLPDYDAPPKHAAEESADSGLMTIKEAIAVLKVSRYTVDAMRRRGQLTTIRQHNRIRLLRQEVDEARRWYSVAKGKV